MNLNKVKSLKNGKQLIIHDAVLVTYLWMAKFKTSWKRENRNKKLIKESG